MNLTTDTILKSQKIEKLGYIKSCTPLDQGIESRNFLVNTISHKYILKSYKNSSTEEIIFEISLLNYLAHFKNKFPLPVGRLFFINSIPCILYRCIDGKGLKLDDITLATLQKIAKLQALMHKYVANFTPKGSRERFSIFDLGFVDTFKCNKYTVKDEQLIKDCRDWLRDRLGKNKSKDFPKSIIHEDLEMENILIDKRGNIKFIDFGESHRAETISDIAIAIKELIINNFGTNTYNLIKAYLTAYEKNNPIINECQLKMLYTLFVRRGLFMFTYFLYKQSKNTSSSLDKRIKTERLALRSLLLSNDLEQKILNFKHGAS